MARTPEQINTIDLQILSLINKKDYSLSDLQREIGVTYKSIFNHIKKLEGYGFIKKQSQGKGKKTLIKPVTDNKKLSVHDHLKIISVIFGGLKTKEQKETLNQIEKKLKNQKTLK